MRLNWHSLKKIKSLQECKYAKDGGWAVVTWFLQLGHSFIHSLNIFVKNFDLIWPFLKAFCFLAIH